MCHWATLTKLSFPKFCYAIQSHTFDCNMKKWCTMPHCIAKRISYRKDGWGYGTLKNSWAKSPQQLGPILMMIDWLFRGFCVVKYDPWNPDPRSPPIPLNHHHHPIFILFTSNRNIPQSFFVAEENFGNLQVSYITKISLICLNWSKHKANCQYRDHVDGQLNICAEI